MNTINLRISNENYDLNTKEFKGNIDFIVDLSKITEQNYSRNKEGLEDIVIRELTNRITERYLDKHADEILEKINIETIVKRIQLSVINRISN